LVANAPDHGSTASETSINRVRRWREPSAYRNNTSQGLQSRIAPIRSPDERNDRPEPKSRTIDDFQREHEGATDEGAGKMAKPSRTAGPKPLRNQESDPVGFEPTRDFRPCRFSKPVHSTTLPQVLACVVRRRSKQHLRQRLGPDSRRIAASARGPTSGRHR
jgi:hypothetical protein